MSQIGVRVPGADGRAARKPLRTHRSWTIRYMLVDTTNWWSGKKVLVAPAWIKWVDWAESKVHVTVTRAQIQTSPEYEPTRPVERDYETRLYDHYGHPRYWRE